MDLAGTWQMTGGGVSIAAEVPGDQYSALLAAGRIPDPYIGLNEQSVQSWRECDWVFSREFELPSDLLACTEIFLRLDYLATVARIAIHGAEARPSRHPLPPPPLPR